MTARGFSAARAAARAVALLAASALLACGGAAPESGAGAGDTLAPADAPPPVAATPGAPFDLPHGREAVVGEGQATLAYRALREESRCPAGAQCVSAGNAAIELALATGAGATATLTLNTDRAPREASAHGWTVRLLALAPAPTVDAPVDTAGTVATLEIESAAAEGAE